MRKQLNEGVWAFPRNESDLEKLQQAMANPIPCHMALDAIGDIVGEDQLFDYIDQCELEDADQDVRIAILERIQQILESDYTGEGIEDELYDYVQNARANLEGGQQAPVNIPDDAEPDDLTESDQMRRLINIVEGFAIKRNRIKGK